LILERREKDMKKVLVIAIALTFVATAVLAGGNTTHKVAIHCKAYPASCTKSYPTFTDCSNIVWTWANLGNVEVMPVFYDLASYSAIGFGLSWPAEWASMSWTRCKGDLSVGGIVYSGDGTGITWTACQTSWAVCLGFGWLASTGAGSVCPIPDPATGDIGVVDCTPSPGPYLDVPMCISCAGIGGTLGDDPCRPTATQPSTWGEIKSMFK
jgi:hypothetical protein